MTAAISQVDSFRAEPHIKAALQVAAKRQMCNLTNTVEVLVDTYCCRRDYSLEGVSADTLSNINLRGPGA